MTTLQERLNRSREVALASQQAEWDRRSNDCAAESARMDRVRAKMLEWLRPAQPWEYGAWLEAVMASGGQPTHFYDYPMRGMYVALCDFPATPLYGSASLSIIVPKGIEVTGELGHIDLFIMRRRGVLFRGFHDPAPKQPTFAPVWSDTLIPS